MKTQLIVGNSYSLKEIEETGYTNTKVTSVNIVYKKLKTYMTFSIPKPNEPRKYKLISISNILYCLTSLQYIGATSDIMDAIGTINIFY